MQFLPLVQESFLFLVWSVFASGIFMWFLNIYTVGIPIVAQRSTNPTSIHEDMGLIPGLARWVKDPAFP